MGFGVCVFSLICSIFLVALDKKADTVDKTTAGPVLTEEEKFRFRDIKTFNLSFWLLCFSCVIVYMAIFPFIQVSSKMLQVKFGFSEEEAGSLFGIPYTISAATSPFLGLLIDKVGRRGLMIVASTVILFAAHVTNMFLPTCQPGDHCYSEVGPLVMIGIGYSIYCAALWGSIPYVVEARTMGTAFGFCTAIQNAGMAVAPTIVGAIIDATATDSSKGYFWASVFWAGICLVGLVLNTWLYFEDLKHNKGALNRVHKIDSLQQLMASPAQGERREIETNQYQEVAPTSQAYFDSTTARGALKRSMLRKSMAK